MNYYYKDGFYCIEGLKETEDKCYIAVDRHYGKINCLIAVDENLQVSAWNEDTGLPISELNCTRILETADKEENIIISRDMSAVLKIKKADSAFIIHDKLVLAKRSVKYFSSSVYRLDDLRMKGTKWREEIAECYVSESVHPITAGAFEVMLFHNGRARKALITPQKTIFSFPLNMKFGNVSGDIVAFSQNEEIGLYDFVQSKELCRFRKESDTEEFSCIEQFTVGQPVWVTPYRFYKDGKTGFLWEDRTYCLFPEKRTNELSEICRLINLQTAELSPIYYRTDAKNVSENRIILSDRNRKSGLIDYNFREILPVVYQEINYLKKLDLYLLKKENQYGIADADGTLLSPAVWDEIEIPSEKYYTICMTVTKDGKKSIMLPDGSLLTSLEWDDADVISFRTVCLWKHLPQQEDTQKQQKYFSVMQTESNETLLEGIFYSIELLTGGCLKVQKENLTGIFSIYENRWLSELELCSVTVEGNRVIVQTLINPERREFDAE